MIYVNINARLHDEARVVSANFKLSLKSSGDADKLIGAMAAGMEETNLWAKKNDVFIGHVKGFVSWGENSAVMLSTVGEAVEIKGSEERPEAGVEVDVGTANIVFGVELGEVEKRVEAFVSEVLKAMGEQAEIEFEHEDDCECGCHAHEHHHHHEHGEDCECGCHDHEHHHHHEHGEDCECGCHDHEHHEHHHHHHDHHHE